VSNPKNLSFIFSLSLVCKYLFRPFQNNHETRLDIFP
jgi:hypothetical protein